MQTRFAQIPHKSEHYPSCCIIAFGHSPELLGTMTTLGTMQRAPYSTIALKRKATDYVQRRWGSSTRTKEAGRLQGWFMQREQSPVLLCVYFRFILCINKTAPWTRSPPSRPTQGARVSIRSQPLPCCRPHALVGRAIRPGSSAVSLATTNQI